MRAAQRARMAFWSCINSFKSWRSTTFKYGSLIYSNALRKTGETVFSKGYCNTSSMATASTCP